MSTPNFPFNEPDVVAEMMCDLETAVTHACAVIDALRQEIRDLRAAHACEPPEYHRDLTPEIAMQRCRCGVRVGRHYDGWSGTRLDCAEALSRHGKD